MTNMILPLDRDQIDQGITALEAENKALARRLLKRAIMQDANDGRIWLALSEAVVERGLFEDQKRSAVALTHSVARYGVAHMIGQMDYGKTRTLLAAVELIRAIQAGER